MAKKKEKKAGKRMKKSEMSERLIKTLPCCSHTCNFYGGCNRQYSRLYGYEKCCDEYVLSQLQSAALSDLMER